MSKYIYTTIYEQFTGLKPPEPKNHKPRRRRGYGHPYRMRLNMQEDGQPEESLDAADVAEDFDQQSQSFLSPPAVRPAIHKTPVSTSTSHRNAAQVSTPRPVMNGPTMGDEYSKAEAAPKVTYKKRRHYSEGAINLRSLGNE